MSSPPRNDAWQPYRGNQQRAVFVRKPGKFKPLLGYVLCWPIAGTGGRFLVTWFDDDDLVPGLCTRWLRRDQIEPIFVDPNWFDHPPWGRRRR